MKILTMDLIDDICRYLRFEGETYFRTRLRGDWAVRLGADGLKVRFHLVLQGHCWVCVHGFGWRRLQEGDWVLIPHGAEQVLASEQQPAVVTELADLIPRFLDDDGVLGIEPDDDGTLTRLLCGFCRFDESVTHPLLESLPALICIDQQASATSPWLADAIRTTVTEVNHAKPGMRSVVGRLVEILFIQSLRYLQESEQPSGFFAATANKQLNRALAAIHTHPGKSWTVAEMADVAAMSRTQFAQRFRGAIGRTPNEYLTEWRFLRARKLLRESQLSMADVAERAGYSSVPSFTRRFMQRFGVGPGQYRRAG